MNPEIQDCPECGMEEFRSTIEKYGFCGECRERFDWNGTFQAEEVRLEE